MININSKIKKVIPLVLGGVALSVIFTSLYKQKKRIEEKEICLDTLLGEQDLVIDELIYQQDIITEMKEDLESFNDMFHEEIYIHEIEEEDN